MPNWSNGVPQTFQVVIEGMAGGDMQNKIYFFYKSITLDYPTTVGIEDQVGNKGTAYDYANLYDGAGLLFKSYTPWERIKHLTIRLTKGTDSDATILIDSTKTGGYNVKLEETTDPYEELFAIALGGTASLLLVGVPVMAGVIFEGALITVSLAGWYSKHFSPVDPIGIDDAGPGESEAYVKAEGCVESGPGEGGLPVDSTLGTWIVWEFNDANNKDHSLTITAELGYGYGIVPKKYLRQ